MSPRRWPSTSATEASSIDDMQMRAELDVYEQLIEPFGAHPGGASAT